MIRHAYAFAVLTVLSVAAATGVAADRATGGPVIIMGELVLKPGQDVQFRKLAAQMVEHVKRSDHGNLRYEFYSAAPMQRGQTSDARPDVWVFVEEWADAKAAADHAKWAGPIVGQQWRAMSESMKFQRLTEVDLSAAGSP